MVAIQQRGCRYDTGHQYQYDGGQSGGNSNLTNQYPRGGAAERDPALLRLARSTRHYQKGVRPMNRRDNTSVISYTTFDNLGRALVAFHTMATTCKSSIPTACPIS